MNKTLLAIFCIFLIVSSPVSAYGYYGDDQDTQNLGEALIIDVDHIEPTPIRSDYFQNREFNAYVFLNGKTLGTMLFGENSPDNAPFFGDMKIRNIQLTPNKESSQYISGLSSIVRPNGEELSISSNGDINLGYTRVRFKRMPVENEVPDTIDVDVTARIYFDVNTGFGSFGTQSLNLKVNPNEDIWKETAEALEASKIWGGRGYLRVVEISGNTAKVQLYDGGLNKVFLGGSETLVAGDEAKQFNLPGAPSLLENFLTIKLDRISRDPNTAKLLVEDLDTKTVSTVNVVKGMKPFIGSSWEVKEIYSDRIVFVNDDGDQKLLNLGIQATPTSDPCSSFTPLSSSQLVQASSSDLYCQSIVEYQKAVDFASGNSDLLYQSYIGIAKAYDGLFATERAFEYYQLARDKNPTKFDQEYGAILQGVERRLQEKLNYFVLDEKVVSLLGISIGAKSDSFVYFEGDFKSNPIEKKVGDTLIAGAVDDQSNKYNWVVTEINANSITIEQEYIGTGTRGLTRETRTLELNKEEVVPFQASTKLIYIDNIKISESAIVTISPGTRDNYGTSEFTIHLPIEKRLWDWTPEEIDKMISSTEKSMLKLDKIVDKLGNVIKTWKLVCFSTFAILSIKNAFFRNPASKLAQDRARDQCVTSTGRAVGTAEYNECYNSQAVQDQIKSDTESSKAALDHAKDVMDGFSWEDDSPEAQAARKRAASELGISEDELILLNRYEGLSTEDLSEMIHNNQAWGDESEVNEWKGDKLSNARAIKQAVDAEIGNQDLSEAERAAIEFKYISAPSTESYDSQQYRQERDEAIQGKIDEAYTNPQRVTGANREPLPVRTEDGRQYVYVNEGGEIQKIEVFEAKDNEGKPIEGYYHDPVENKIYLGGTVLNNYMVGYQGATTVQYDEQTKRPVIIPFQYKTDDFSDSVNSILGYGNYIIVDEDATYHYSIWNPGPDGIINTQDDEPVITSSQLQPENRVAGYSRLASEIERAYSQATVASGKEGESVVVRGQRYATNLYAGAIGSATSSQGNCEDIMSPGDCQILYNVCDPVMCPPSRFNLGGRWNVLGAGTVVQKGIIGSLVLGWGNGDLLPICLTGIHAGLENIYSMLGSFRDCLETARVDGESVGVCNEIRSLYMCDILWQEALALVNVAGELSSWVSTSILGRSSGGGEYKFWESSWSKLGNSVSFFTKDYASSAFAAFTSRSTDEIGSEICKAAIFGKFPAGGDLLGQLTSPESPPQFTGWFEEDRFTDVNLETGLIQSTSVGTGQSAYRVYYHIYAGRDRDITYRVILKNIAGEVIPVTDERSLTSGNKFLKKGESVDKSFVLPNLPPGFTQMCIIIDSGAPNCGFGSISSSFTAEYLKQQIVQGAIGKIESAEECVPEQRNYIPGALTSGIRRVCSVYDPDGAGDEWEYVGSCGFDEQGRNLGNCYLYAKGVEQSIIDSSYNLTKTLQTQTENDTYIDKEKEFEVYLAEKAKTEFAEIKQLQSVAGSSEDKIEVIDLYHDFAGRAPDNDMTSESFYNVGEILRQLATQTFVKEKVEEIQESATSCTIEYETGSSIYDDAIFFWSSDRWNIDASKTELRTESIGTNIVDLNLAITSETDCEAFKDHKGGIYDICKQLVGASFEKGAQVISQVGNLEEVELKVMKDNGETYEPDKKKISYQSIIDLCLSERITAPAEELQELVGKPIEVECKKYSELAGKDVTVKIIFLDGVITTGTTVKKVETIDEFVNFVDGVCGLGPSNALDASLGISSTYKYIKVKKEYEDYERTLWSNSEEAPYIDVKQWLKSIILGKYVDEDNDYVVDSHPPFTLKLYRSGGFLGMDVRADYTFVWNGFMLEKLAKSQGVGDTTLNIPDWDLTVNYMWAILEKEWRNVDKIEFRCADSQTVQTYNKPSTPSDEVEQEFKSWVIEQSNICGGRVVVGDISNAIQLANSQVIVNRKCDCGSSCNNYAEWITKYSETSGVDPILILSLMMQESQCRTDEGSTSSHGLMQINANYHCGKYGLSEDREECAAQLKSRPETNIRLGVEILKSFYDIYKDKGYVFNGCNKQKTYYGWEAALRAYNGPGCDPRYPEQDDFVEDIMARYNYLVENAGSQTDITLSPNVIARTAQQEFVKWNQGKRDECDSGMQDELTTYWNSVGWGTNEWKCGDTAWSAAFISYVMKKSGVNFPFDSAHSRYFVEIKNNPNKYDCKTYDTQKDLDKIKVGDVICANREGSSKTYSTIVAGDTTHCDVVTSAGTSSLEVIGGNVEDSVAQKTVTRSKIGITGKDSYFGFVSCDSPYMSRNFNWNYNGKSYSISFDISNELYSNLKSTNDGLQDYTFYTSSNNDRLIIEDISNKLMNLAINSGDENLAPYLAASFVQSLKYTSDKTSTGFNDYAKYPYETLYENGGDCEDTSILLAKILKNMGYGVVILYLDVPNSIIDHVAVGVKCSQNAGVCYSYSGTDYFYLETTGENWDVGEVPPQFQGLSAKIINV